MAEESIFRLLAVRPAKIKKKINGQFRVVTNDNGGSSVFKKLKAVVTAGATRPELEKVAKEEKKKGIYLKTIENLPFDISIFLDWLSEKKNAATPITDFSKIIKERYSKTPKTIAKEKAFNDSIMILRETLLIDSVLEEEEESDTNLDILILSFKVLQLIKGVAEDTIVLQKGVAIGDFLNTVDLIMPELVHLLKMPSKEDDDPDPDKDDPEEEEQKKLREKLAILSEAHRAISKVATDERFREVSKIATTVPNQRISSLENRINDLITLNAVSKETSGKIDMVSKLIVGNSGVPQNEGDTTDSQFILSSKSVDRLPVKTKEVLSELQFDIAKINPVKVVAEIENEMAYVGGKIKAKEAHEKIVVLGGAYLSADKFNESIGYARGIKDKLKAVVKQCKFKAGIGDLLMVKQKLKAYELAEFAHVENVLAGELREREHRRLNVREEEFITEIETETESERNLQSTERHELQTEAEKTVKSQFELEAGLQISGSYGPVVSFSANLNTGFSTSTEESKKKVSSYSREVTEKSSERVRERVREERRNKNLEEIEEINKHAINNENAENGHVRGIYRWLNKIYDAQVFNYGQRMMYEFVIPEPAAYFLYALVDNPPKEMELIKPKAPTYSGKPLKPSNLTRSNYHNYVSKYQVTNANEPPAQYQTIAFFDKQDKTGDHTHFGRSGKIEIPKGYAAYGATVQSDYTFHKDKGHHYRVMVGGREYNRSESWGGQYKSFHTRREKELSYAIHLFYSNSFTLGVDVFCELTSEGYTKWKQDTYDSIMNAYLQQKADYEEQIAAQEIAEGIQILGRNPLENRRLEKEELKKLVIMMLTGINNININVFLNTNEPRMDIDKACKIGSQIRFFENIFEWQNMLYVLYPYFWGRKSKWISALHLTDPDPDFAAFLKAGAARVQVPVRPGFEKAIAHFCQFGKIWEGNDIPLKNDKLYVPIINEITENLGKLNDGVPYPEDSEPWEVTVPTSLVVLQDLEEIPNIRDILTGKPIDIRNAEEPDPEA
ncbi:hypothetical protein [Aquimarina longa]|uniref:hypothetical protein n=1 Tax=Aquimarina longa TaxID=1080221 RepID=UPI0007831471|nr:hypothetical protein [Aquimarina longa]